MRRRRRGDIERQEPDADWNLVALRGEGEEKVAEITAFRNSGLDDSSVIFVTLRVAVRNPR